MDRTYKIHEWIESHGDRIENWLEELAECEIEELHTKHVKEVDIIAAHCDLHKKVCDFLVLRETFGDDDDGDEEGNPRPNSRRYRR